MAIFEPILAALNDAEVRYVVVGGVAVVLHGYARLTAALDLAVDLSPREARKVVAALRGVGLGPSAPVDPDGFGDAEVRARWISEKDMRVFSMRDPIDPMRAVDLFVEEPVPFEELWGRSEVIDLGGLPVRVASVEDLIRMKRGVDRPQDRADVAALEAIRERREGSS
ncbi:MAG TPA: DUF6036 family nucleotidyltransferase [Actinomycetota bacterium]|nr:DUF6036 family nucleotidyltransferase [Actinomycetota bacterium]